MFFYQSKATQWMTLIFLFLFTTGCFNNEMILPPGSWRLVIHGEKGDIPALIEVIDQNNFYLIRGEEKIQLKRLNQKHQKSESIILAMHIYNSELVLEKLKDNTVSGYWYRKDKSPVQKIPLSMIAQKNTFFDGDITKSSYTLEGKWRWIFDPQTEKETQDLGIFNQQGEKIKGSIATPTGDYGLIQGIISDKSIKLATFDGVFAFVIDANFKDENTLQGTLSSLSTTRPFMAFRDPHHSLPDATVVTKAKNANPVVLSLPSVYGPNVTLEDAKYKNKPVILQIYGSWCPNCLDETKFLSDWFKNNRHLNIEILALSFERATTLEMAKRNVVKSIDTYQIPYEFLIAGIDAHTKPEDILPITNFISFPTTIFLDKNHKIIKIHAGFSGPATGEEFDKFRKFFSETVEKL